MRVHHLNCISMCPPGRRLMDGRKDRHGKAMLTCHCLLVEAGNRLILVDTGFGTGDVLHPRPRLAPLFLRGLCRPDLRMEDTALEQLRRMGIQPNDVTDIVLTHLDFDHAGGLDDFPHARVHLSEAERHHAVEQRTALDRRRFRPQQWATSMGRWLTYVPQGEQWFGFEAVRELEHLPPEILLVPLHGHTLGHSGVAIYNEGRWLLHAGDAYFYEGEMDPNGYSCTPGLRAYQRLMEKDRRLRLENQQRLRELVRDHRDEVQVFCAHDPTEFEVLASRQPTMFERGRAEEPAVLV